MLRIVLQVLLGLTALLSSTLDYIAHDKRTRLFKRFRIALFCVMAVALIAGVVTTVMDDRRNEQKLVGLKNDLAGLQTATNRTLDAVTGVQGFAYINLVGQRLLLINEGPSPVYDFSVRAWDPSDYRDVRTSQEFDALEPRALRFAVASIPPNSAREIATIPRLNGSYNAFEATMVARNGSFSQQLVMRGVDGIWRSAYRVFRGLERVESAKLLERSDPQFPRDRRGDLLWDEH